MMEPRMADAHHARDGKDIEAAVQWALAQKKSLEIVGHGSKRALGRPAQVDATLDLSAIAGITLYEPEELVLSARAGTTLATIEDLLDSKASCSGSPPAGRPSAACSPPTSRAHAASRRAPRATTSSASLRCRDAARPSSRAAGW
jgi:hypothetical protein